MDAHTDKLEAFARLLDVLSCLRKHCPWDREQTYESLRTNTIEEAMELSEALMDGQTNEIKKELGDVLLHVLFYARIAEEQEEFSIVDVCNALCNKLIYRHPHIYGSSQVDNAKAVASQWEKVKQTEKDGNRTLLSGVPRSLPSLIKAHRMTQKAAAVGFDWSDKSEVWDKVKEEIQEVHEAIQSGDGDKVEAEFGDLLFAVVNAARLHGVNSDNALERTNRKFRSRLEYIESEAGKQGHKLADLSLHEMDQLWNQAKETE